MAGEGGDRLNAQAPGRRWFVLGLAMGLPIMGIGVWGIFHDSGVTAPANFALWFIGGNIVHDAILAPAVVLVSFALRLVVSPRWLGRVQWALALTGIVALFALIPLLGLGHYPVEHTVQPLNYWLGLAIVVAAIWVSALLAPRRQRARSR
jgi:hypothetical protein